MLALHGKDIFLEQAKGMVLEVTRIVPAHVLEFEAIKEQVKKDFYKEKASAPQKTEVQQIQPTNAPTATPSPDDP